MASRLNQKNGAKISSGQGNAGIFHDETFVGENQVTRSIYRSHFTESIMKMFLSAGSIKAANERNGTYSIRAAVFHIRKWIGLGEAIVWPAQREFVLFHSHDSESRSCANRPLSFIIRYSTINLRLSSIKWSTTHRGAITMPTIRRNSSIRQSEACACVRIEQYIISAGQ